MINPSFTNVKILKIKYHCATFKRSKDSLFREGSILSHKKRHVKNLKRALSANFLNELFLIASNKGAFSVSERAPSALNTILVGSVILNTLFLHHEVVL